MYVVYWARHVHHSHAMSEGYVGVTSKTLDDRKRSHYKVANSTNRPNVHFHSVLKKYQNEILWTVLYKNLSEKEAFEKEFEYRPNINIGWNSDRGGIKAISPEWYANVANKEAHRLKTSEATKLKIAEKDSAQARSRRAKEIWDSEGYRQSREGLFAGERNPQFGKFGATHPAANHTKTKEGLKRISDTHRGKVLSRQTRDKMSVTRIEIFADQKAARLKRIDEERQDKKRVREKDKKAGKFKAENARASKFSNVERQLICTRRMDGETFAVIGNTYGKGVSTIRNICQVWGPKNGYPFERKIGKSALKKTLSYEDKKAICEAFANGRKVREIASKYYLTTNYIYTILAEWGPSNDIPYIKRRLKK